MSYLNGQIGYRDELLMTRSVIKKENYVLLEPDGIVKNAIPGYENCDVTILGSPQMGADFADYLVTAHEGGKCAAFGGEGIECFLYLMEGEVKMKNADTETTMTEGGFMFSPAGNVVTFENVGSTDAKLYIYKRRYDKIEGYDAPETVVGNANDIPWVEYEGMKNCHIKDFLPAAGDFRFDMNFHILKFELGASHGYIETHVQEHGMLFLSGKAMYRLDEDWVPVKTGDYVFVDAYCPQACYAVGKEEACAYIYSKDCNRDIRL